MALPPLHDVCAIDFGTSNSAVALPGGRGAAAPARLVALEPEGPTMPTAVFYRAEARPGEPERLYGRAAVAAYVDGQDGRLMRSMKSVLGSTLADARTDVGGGRQLRYVDIVAGYLRELRARAESEAGRALTRVVLGRPVYFVDDDPVRDGRAQAALEAAARAVGFDDVRFQYEPIAAAFAHEASLDHEQLVLVADIGGGTSDFSLVRVGPRRRSRPDRQPDILANHGVHVAGTDFDRHLDLATVLPLMGYGGRRVAAPGEPARELPSAIYFDLATWHLINTAYAPARIAECRSLRSWYADACQHRRLMTVLQQRLGHALVAAAERAKIEVAEGGRATIALDAVEPGLAAALDADATRRVLADDQARIVAAAAETLRRGGVDAASVGAVFFTGGSTGLASLTDGIAALLPAATPVRGDRFASVVQGLGLHAARLHGA